MASAGVHVLLEMSARIEASGGSLALACLHPMVARVMSLTGADELVPVRPTVAEALAANPECVLRHTRSASE